MIASAEKLELSIARLTQNGDGGLYIRRDAKVALVLPFRPEAEDLHALADEFNGALRSNLVEWAAALLPENSKPIEFVQWHPGGVTSHAPPKQVAIRICLVNDQAQPRTEHCLIGADFEIGPSAPGYSPQSLAGNLSKKLNSWFAKWAAGRLP